jgi:hypothetical protein
MSTPNESTQMNASNTQGYSAVDINNQDTPVGNEPNDVDVQSTENDSSASDVNSQGNDNQPENNLASPNATYDLKTWKYALGIAMASGLSIGSEFAAYYCLSPEIKDENLSNLSHFAIGFGVNWLVVEVTNIANGSIKASCHMKDPNKSAWKNNANSVLAAGKNHLSNFLDMLNTKGGVGFAAQLLQNIIAPKDKQLFNAIGTVVSNIAASEIGNRNWWNHTLNAAYKNNKKASSTQEAQTSCFSNMWARLFGSKATDVKSNSSVNADLIQEEHSLASINMNNS